MKILLSTFLLALLVACVPASAPGESGRYLVYFDEFSADLSPQALQIVADAAQRARTINASAIRVEARASATGGVAANQYLAQARSQVVADQLARDGVPPAVLRQVPIGQTGSGDPTVAERRVDIVLER
jgi:outer membrane protein OmpA-like peptidoglycan-associated protein